jgi:hypothetical protein
VGIVLGFVNLTKVHKNDYDSRALKLIHILFVNNNNNNRWKETLAGWARFTANFVTPHALGTNTRHSINNPSPSPSGKPPPRGWDLLVKNE